MPEVTADDHTLGPAGALVTVLEYGDYECPFCRGAYRDVHRMLDLYPGSILFAFRNFPIQQLHPHAEQAAEAAEAAAAQGRFWPMHGLLFENQRRLGDRDLRGYAEQLGLGLERFDRDLADHVHAPRVHEDFLSGVRSGVNGTPTFYVNGVRYDDSYELETLHAALEGAAASQRG